MRSLMANVAALSLGMLMAPIAYAFDEHDRSLRIYNETSSDLCIVQIDHVDTYWEGNDLGQPCLKPGRYRTVDPGWQEGYCKMDINFVTRDGRTASEWDFNICVEADFYLQDHMLE